MQRSHYAARIAAGTVPGRRLRAPLASRRHRRLRHRDSGSLIGVLIAATLLAAVALAGTSVAVGAGVFFAVIDMASQGLPDPALLERLSYAQPTIVYDRSGTIELGRFQAQDRRVVTFDEVPPIVVAATTAAEDRGFWENPGFDPGAIAVAAVDNLTGASARGASTITQQLVEARLLPEELTAPGVDRYRLKISEIVQAARVTAAYPGEEGKRRIMTAYLNQIFYGHDAYGIASAAGIFFGVTDLVELTPAQAALLAGLPKSPSALDPYLFATADKQGRLVVAEDSPPMRRRAYVIAGLVETGALNATEAAAALAEPAILAGEKPIIYRAPHFVWRVRAQLVEQLGSLEAVNTGGYRVITTLDWKAQQVAEKFITVSAVLPHVSKAKAAQLVKSLHVSKRDRAWAMRLSGRGPRNGAMVALDYRTGDILAYVGSAGYYRDDLRSRRFEPKFDVLSQGYRQPGSAWKPIVYATAFDRHKLTPGSLLLDVSTAFGRRWAPHDADRRERGPVLVREALQWSLNIPAIRALHRVGNEAVAEQATKMGIRFAGGTKLFMSAGLAAAIGTVEVRPLDLTSAYGVLANGGRLAPPRLILTIDGPDGEPVWAAGKAKAREVIDPRAAFMVTEIIAGNTDPKQNPVWAKVLRLGNGPRGSRRPAAAKTGTTNETKDYATYGFLAPPKDSKAPGLVVGVWMGNSDHSESRGRGREVISLDGPARVWQAFMRDYTSGMPVADFKPSAGLVRSRIDAWTGGKPGPWTTKTTSAWFIKGTQPGAKQGGRQAGSDVRHVMRFLAHRPDACRAGQGLARRRPGLDGAGTTGRRSGRSLRHRDRVSTRTGQLGWADGRGLRLAAAGGLSAPAEPGPGWPRLHSRADTCARRGHEAQADAGAVGRLRRRRSDAGPVSAGTRRWPCAGGSGRDLVSPSTRRLRR